MPNGGSDCCGTCWFNRANGGRRGYVPDRAGGDDYCELRGLAVPDAFWTYCANHPQHNPERLTVPVGPVYVCDSYPYTRRVWVDCPDTPEVRDELLRLLAEVPETPRAEYPSAIRFDIQVIDQLLAFREARAAAGLRRVAGFDPARTDPRDDFHRTNRLVVAHAVEALAALVADGALAELERCVRFGLADAQRAGAEYDAEADEAAAVRYHAVRGLGHCRGEAAKRFLAEATKDPHPEVAAFAGEALGRVGRPAAGGPP